MRTEAGQCSERSTCALRGAKRRSSLCTSAFVVKRAALDNERAVVGAILQLVPERTTKLGPEADTRNAANT